MGAGPAGAGPIFLGRAAFEGVSGYNSGMETFPQLGAFPESTGTRFRVYASDAKKLELVLEADGAARTIEMTAAAHGVHETFVDGVTAGARYRYALDGAAPFPDPASRFQPEGVHGPSEVIDPTAFAWQDDQWKGRALAGMVIYELHIGTFTPEGTFAAAAQRLSYLRDLGITAIELMPVHDFPGERNWGYDSAALYAPPRSYGRPEDLRRFVDTAHGLGLSVLLDVVYNHLGPDGAYIAAYDKTMLNNERRTPWGSSMNLDGARSLPVREFLIQNALYWQRDFHVDGFRLDATSAIDDRSGLHLLAELGERLRAAAGPRGCVLIAEDGRNLNTIIHTREQGGHGIDGEWCFDFHHQFHRVLTGERHHYYEGFRSSAHDLALALKQGWVFTGQDDPYGNAPRGTDPTGIPAWRFVAYLQSHDEVGNRPMGDRLHAVAGLAEYRGALALLLGAAQTPMLFMGDEWAAGTPFHFFTDHKPTIGAKVTAGRREFYKIWPGFNTARGLDKTPDPQDVATFESSHLDWAELDKEPHASTLRYVRRLLALRHSDAALSATNGEFDSRSVGRRAVLVWRRAPGARPLAIIGSFGSQETIRMSNRTLGGSDPWETVLTSEDREFCADPQPAGFRWNTGGLEIEFQRPGAVILRGPHEDPV